MVKLSGQQTGASHKWNVAVVGIANMDYLIRAPRFPEPGELVSGSDFLEVPGGKGVLQALGASRLGARVGFVGRVGSDDRGKRILSYLKNEGVDISFMGQDKMRHSGVAFSILDSAGNRRIVVSPEANEGMTKQDVYRAAELFSNSRVSIIQSEIPADVIVAAVQISANFRSKIILDGTQPQVIPDEILRLVDIVRPSVRADSRETARIEAEKLLWKGVKSVIVQVGQLENEGNLLVWDEYELWLPKLAPIVVDQSGADDVFLAAFAVSLSEGAALPDAAIFGNAAAGLVVAPSGNQAAPPNRKAVLDFLKTVEPEKRGRPSLRLVS